MTLKRIAFWGTIGLLLLVWAGLTWWPEKARQPSPPGTAPKPEGKPAAPATAPGSSTEHPNGPVTTPPEAGPEPRLAARVNGEPIYEADVLAGIDRKTFGLMIGNARRNRLDRMIFIAEVRQYLKARKIEVSAEEVAKQLEDLKRNPPAAGCACCRYNSLQDFLAANLMTEEDLVESIRNDIGMTLHVTALWDSEYPAGEKRNALLARERRRLENAYMAVSHIFFKTAQQPDYQIDPDKVRKEAGNNASAVWERLRKGEDFAKVARECSEDAFSAVKGGGLGCVPANAFGASVKAAVQQLATGACSRPVESPWGFHVMRRDAMQEQDVLDLLQMEYKDRKLQELFASIEQDAKVERFDGNGK